MELFPLVRVPWFMATVSYLWEHSRWYHRVEIQLAKVPRAASHKIKEYNNYIKELGTVTFNSTVWGVSVTLFHRVFSKIHSKPGPSAIKLFTLWKLLWKKIKYKIILLRNLHLVRKSANVRNFFPLIFGLNFFYKEDILKIYYSELKYTIFQSNFPPHIVL
jgi:hypothetical protein